MSATCKRFVVRAGGTPNPRAADAPQRDLVQGVAAINVEPTIIRLGDEQPVPDAEFYDLLVDPAFDESAFVVLHEAELQDSGEIVIKRNLLDKGNFPHTWAGWPIPGDD